MNIQDVTGFNAVQYNALVEQAEARGVTSARVDEALLSAIEAGKDFTSAVVHVAAQLPELSAPTTTRMPASSDWVGLPSPGALFAGLIVQDAAEQRRTNRSIIQAQGSQIVDLMEQQADKIEKGAIQKFACACAGAVVNFIAGAASLGIAAGGVGRNAETGKLSYHAGKTADSQLTSVIAQSWQTMISSGGTILSQSGDYAQSMRSAEGKRLEAEQEQIRTMMEQTKQTNEALRDLVSKAQEFANAMQQNMNQTRTKILG